MPRPAGDEIILRPLAPEDAEGVLHVHHAAVHRTAAADYPTEVLHDWSPPVTAQRLERYRQTSAGEEETTLVAVAGGRIVGFASIVAALGELRALYVSPDVGRRGVGARLLHGVEKLAREQGLAELHLDSSLTAERFYGRHGYESEWRATHTLRTGLRMPCVRMRKRLARNGAITLRPATEADAEFVFAVLRAGLRPHVVATWGAWDEAWQHRRFLESFVPAMHQIVEESGRAVGCLAVEERSDQVFLARIFLLPEAQGRGIGTGLIRTLCASAHRRRLPVELSILKVNPARRLYERLGFTVVGETETHFRMSSPPQQGTLDATGLMSTAIRVRPATEEDIGVLERELPLHTPSRHRECLADQAAGRLTYLVAWQGSAPVGQGLIHWPGPRNPAVQQHLPDCPEIFMLGVPEPLRSRGVGRALIARLEQVAADRGMRRIGLGVALTNPRARSLYERLGYHEVGAPPYVDRWYWVDASGMERVEEDPCVFLVKALPAA